MTSKVKYLIFDIETVADGDLIRRVRFPDEGLSPREAIEKYRRQLVEETGRDVMPATFVLPVSVAIAKVDRDLTLQDLTVLDAPAFRPEEIVRKFWQGWLHYGKPTLVTFNGRSYDLPVMELAAFRFGLSLPDWFNISSRSFEQSRNRYNLDAHLDLQDVLTNYGAFRLSGGLNLLAAMIDKPGKSGIDGSQVQDLYLAGQIDKINDYCRCDVLDTYFVFLRTQVLLGRLTTEEEQRLSATAREFLTGRRKEHPAYEYYLKHWDERLLSRIEVSAATGNPARRKL